MANCAFLGVWCKDFSEAVMPGRLKQFLGTVPFSSARPGFTSLVIRAVGPEEPPLFEQDLRAVPLSAEDVAQLVGEYLHADCCYEVQAYWDLWIFDSSSSTWRLLPQRLEISCSGEEYDEGSFTQTGHFLADAGFEHLFTGHAGLLGPAGQSGSAPQHPVEAEFLSRMAQPAHLREYHEKTRENVLRLLAWMTRIESVIPGARCRLWSEGEDNFEARLDQILAAR